MIGDTGVGVDSELVGRGTGGDGSREGDRPCDESSASLKSSKDMILTFTGSSGHRCRPNGRKRCSKVGSAGAATITAPAAGPEMVPAMLGHVGGGVVTTERQEISEIRGLENFGRLRFRERISRLRFQIDYPIGSGSGENVPASATPAAVPGRIFIVYFPQNGFTSSGIRTVHFLDGVGSEQNDMAAPTRVKNC